MNARQSLLVVMLAAATLAGVAQARVRSVTDPEAPRSLPEEGPVSVRWEDPAQFSEIRNSRNEAEARRGNWVSQLAQHLRKSAQKRLPPGERLEVTITDIDLAGDYEPGLGVRGHDTRVIRELYPPRVTLTFRRTGADGQVIAEGTRELSDSGFLMGEGTAGPSSEPLRYEKNLIDRWLSRELPKPAG